MLPHIYACVPCCVQEPQARLKREGCRGAGAAGDVGEVSPATFGGALGLCNPGDPQHNAFMIVLI